MPTRTYLHAPVLALLVVLTACGGGMENTVDWDTSADFSELRTWSWISPVGAEGNVMPSLQGEQRDEVVRYIVEEALAERGYVLDPDAPDFLIGYHPIVESQVGLETLRSYYDYWGYGAWYGGLNSYVSPGVGTSTTYEYIQMGTLILDIVDPSDRILMWRGIVKAEVDTNASPYVRAQLVQEAIVTLLDQFPP